MHDSSSSFMCVYRVVLAKLYNYFKTAKWSESKNLPGAFTGRVDTRMLTPDELAPNVGKKQQAWVKKDTFLRARPIQGGIGQFLLQKMGWNEGQGLGKQNDGGTEPLMMDFNTNRKGMVQL